MKREIKKSFYIWGELKKKLDGIFYIFGELKNDT